MGLENDLSFSGSQENTSSFLFKQHIKYFINLIKKLTVLNSLLDSQFQCLGKCRQVRISSMLLFYNGIFIQLNKTLKRGLGKQCMIVSIF